MVSLHSLVSDFSLALRNMLTSMLFLKTFLLQMLLGGTGSGQSPTASCNVSNEIPSLVARNLLQKSTATSLDFHPLHQTVLLG